jgi:small subunit ribosomal protein S16
MAVKIRFRQQGRNNRQTYRLVVTDIRNPRDGKYLETIGTYDPLKESGNVMLNAERLQFWLGHGAELSETAENWVKKVAPHVAEEIRARRVKKRDKQVAERKARKKA